MHHLEIRSPPNPLRVKRLKQKGGAAVGNAIADALRQLGHPVTSTPLTPGAIGRSFAG